MPLPKLSRVRLEELCEETMHEFGIDDYLPYRHDAYTCLFEQVIGTKPFPCLTRSVTAVINKHESCADIRMAAREIAERTSKFPNVVYGPCELENALLYLIAGLLTSSDDIDSDDDYEEEWTETDEDYNPEETNSDGEFIEYSE